MVEKFNEADMKNIIIELNTFFKREIDAPIEGNEVELSSLNDETGHFVLSIRKNSIYEIYLRFNQDYKDDHRYHKTLVVSVLAFRNDSDTMESKVLIKLAEIVKKYGYEYIIYEAITERMKSFAVNHGLKGYSSSLRPFQVDPNDTSFNVYTAPIANMPNNGKVAQPYLSA